MSTQVNILVPISLPQPRSSASTFDRDHHRSESETTLHFAMASREAGMSGMAGMRASIYNVFMRRNSVYVTACILGSYFATHAYLAGTDSLWKTINKGVG